MTFESIVKRVAQRANVSSQEALTRIGESVNEKHRAITSSLGFETTSQGAITGLTVSGSPYITFGNENTGVTKLQTILHPETHRPLEIVNIAELRMQTTRDWPPRAFAIYRTNSFSVTVLFDATADTNNDVISAEGLLRINTLVADDEPFFSENFHDILIQGALEIEFRILKDRASAKDAKDAYDARLEALNLHYATNSWQNIYQNRTGPYGRRFLV